MKLDESAKLSEWLPACCRNERQAQEKLYRHYFAAMVILVNRYTRDEDKVISIVNDGFLRAFKKIDKYDFSGSFEGWLRTIVFHSVSNYFKKEKNNFKVVSLTDSDRISSNEALFDLYYEDLISVLKTLPEMSRKVFEMYAIQGYKHMEIAEYLSISEGTSKWHVSNSRKLLKEKLKNRNTRKYVN